MPTHSTVHVLRRLKGFVAPDTKSQHECWVEPGVYDVLELRSNHPTKNTDYARIDIAGPIDCDTWICTRWRQTVYADIRDAQEPPTQVTVPAHHPDGIEESVLLGLLPSFARFKYVKRGARYPYPLEGVQLPLVPPWLNNCCTFVEAFIVKAWQSAYPDFAWDTHAHAKMMIRDPAKDRFSPVKVLLERGVGIALDEHAPPAPWSVMQGYYSAQNGHTMLLVAHDPATDRVLTLECNNDYGLDGVGFRNLGMLRDFPGCAPPPQWWANPAAPTWKQLRRSYWQRRLCALKINATRWATPLAEPRV